MKVFISVDMEGISGLVHWSQVEVGGKEHGWARQMMAADANAAIEGVLAAGATEVVVNDAHSQMRNLLPLELHRDARLVSGSFKPLSMMEGIDETFDQAFLIGYHARAGAPGVLSHTYSSVLHELRVNGRPAGETALNAAVAGVHGVPVTLVTGDRAVAEEAREYLGDVETVAVKAARGRFSASCLHPEAARDLIRSAAIRAVGLAGSARPFSYSPPYIFEMTFADPGMAEAALLVPGAERLDGCAVRYRDEDFLRAFKAMRAMIALAITTTV